MGKYVVRKTATGYKFDLKASNGEIIASSEIYSGEPGCMNGLESVRRNAPAAAFEDQTQENFTAAVNPKFEMYEDKAGEYRFRLKARNGEIIAVSEGYRTRRSCLNGIESVRRNAPDSPVQKEYAGQEPAAKGGSAAHGEGAPEIVRAESGTGEEEQGAASPSAEAGAPDAVGPRKETGEGPAPTAMGEEAGAPDAVGPLNETGEGPAPIAIGEEAGAPERAVPAGDASAAGRRQKARPWRAAVRWIAWILLCLWLFLMSAKQFGLTWQPLDIILGVLAVAAGAMIIVDQSVR